MHSINCILIDDERLAREELRLLLQDFPDFIIVGEAANADEGIDLITRLAPDLIFLDIQMPEKSGFDLLEALDHAPQVIFTTAFDQYAIRAFEVNALDYMLKPIRKERMTKTLTKVRAEIQQQKAKPPTVAVVSKDRQVFIKDGDQCHFVKVSTISFIQSVGNYAKLHFEGQSALLHRSLNLLEQKFDPTIFFRVNRQEIINLLFIEKIVPLFKGSLRIHLKDGRQVEVSERRSAKFKERMSI